MSEEEFKTKIDPWLQDKFIDGPTYSLLLWAYNRGLADGLLQALIPKKEEEDHE